MPKRLVSQLCLAVITAWVLSVVGCGPSVVTVEGKVTWDGTPVETGTISFLPADGKGPSFGGELKNGSYRVEAQKPGALGAKNVSITSVRKTGKMIEAGPPAPAGTMVEELLSLSSTEKCEIVDGENKHDFQLKSAGK
jgi:hypothetical protein